MVFFLLLARFSIRRRLTCRRAWRTWFFCNNCKLWDNRCPENKRLHHSMKKFQCTAGHQSFNGPTTRKKSWYKEKRCGKYDSKKKHKKKKKRYRDIEISSESNTDESDLLNGEELMSLRSELEKRIKSLTYIQTQLVTTVRKYIPSKNKMWHSKENLSTWNLKVSRKL